MIMAKSKDLEKPTLLLVDGHSLAFRSFYAYSKGGEGGLTTKDGLPTTVTFGFLKALLENCQKISPQGIVIAFDTATPTFRHEKDPNYKANRDVAPPIFFQDLDQLQEILRQQLGLSLLKAPGYEADDVLGTMANNAVHEGWKVIILSGDRDLFQLVDDEREIAVLYMGGGPYAKNKGPFFVDEAGVLKKLGVLPNKVVDLKALTGDSSDNIPGVKGVGPKTAINLLQENDTLDGIYTALEEIQSQGIDVNRGALKGSVKKKLFDDRSNAYLSRYLAEILIDVPLEEKPRLNLGKVDMKSLASVLEALELKSLISQIPNFVACFSTGGFNANKQDFEKLRKVKSEPSTNRKAIDSLSEGLLPLLSPQVIVDQKSLNQLIEKLFCFKDRLMPVAIDTETTSLNPFKAELVGIGICWGEGKEEIAYIPLGHQSQSELLQGVQNKQLYHSEVLLSLEPWLSSPEHPKALQNAKYDRLIFLRHGILLNGVVIDTLLADYLLDPSRKHALEIMAEREYGFKPITFNELVAKGKTFADVDITQASLYCGMDVHLTYKLAFYLRRRLEKMSPKLITLLDNVEQPLEPVLASMEAIGIRIDIPYLKELSIELAETLQNLEKNAFEIAGIQFNLASPKQLGELLFEKLGLDRKKSRRMKTGWSTDANVLERLESDHPIISLLIEHRMLSKLLSTYVDTLPQLVEEETGRVHTDFNQAVTATGRLSSSNPNLQNIPIRTDFSRRIRKAFLPQDGWLLLSADYSQIELRILAHLSCEEVLQEAYRNGDDVHSLTARLLLDKASVTSEERRLGKTINFGVIYGMGAQRFARATGVTQLEAKNFLTLYKQRYPKVFSFLEMQERLALSRGYVETIMGRRRPFNFDKHGLGRLFGKDPLEIDLGLARRAGLEAQQLRAAANAPIQGSSADIIKVAMVQLQEQLKYKGFPANLLLQVHDELVLEVKHEAIDVVEKLVVETMQNAVSLTVPLLVETGIGNNWMEAK